MFKSIGDIIGVVSLPMRDGNISFNAQMEQARIVVRLPMRDGNLKKFLNELFPPGVVSLPMRDGNPRS